MLRWMTAALALFAVAVPLLAGQTSTPDEAVLPDQFKPRPVRAVVELFTSQGCSSCPAADALLKKISANQKDVMALTVPVDIWDYIGWKDTLATPKNSERQRAYSRLLGSGPVYTPQMVVGGVTQTVGSDAREVDDAIKKATNFLADRFMPARLLSHRNSIIIELGDARPNAELKEATIWLAVVQKSVTVPVKRGENEGQSLTYTNVVREFTPVGVWSGKAVTIQLLRSAFMRPDIEDMIVLIQEADYGPIIGAAWVGM